METLAGGLRRLIAGLNAQPKNILETGEEPWYPRTGSMHNLGAVLSSHD